VLVNLGFANRLIDQEWQLKYRRLVLVERLAVLILKITAERKSINSPYSLILASI
jgi:hypothetical protein